MKYLFETNIGAALYRRYLHVQEIKFRVGRSPHTETGHETSYSLDKKTATILVALSNQLLS
jgi:hypothetical protein